MRVRASSACTWRRTPASPPTSAETGRLHGADTSLIDYNRCGVPLLEIVSRPDIHDPETAQAYLRELQAHRAGARRLGRPDGGGLDPLRRERVGPAPRRAELGTRTETKNLNSVRSLGRAIAYEAERQIAAIEDGEQHRHGDPALGRGPGRHRHAAPQGDRHRLPLLPGPRPGRGPLPGGLGRGAARRRCPSCRRSPASGWPPPGSTPRRPPRSSSGGMLAVLDDAVGRRGGPAGRRQLADR